MREDKRPASRSVLGQIVSKARSLTPPRNNRREDEWLYLQRCCVASLRTLLYTTFGANFDKPLVTRGFMIPVDAHPDVVSTSLRFQPNPDAGTKIERRALRKIDVDQVKSALNAAQRCRPSRTNARYTGGNNEVTRATASVQYRQCAAFLYDAAI